MVQMILNEIGGADTDKISVKTLISATKRDCLSQFVQIPQTE